MSFFGYDVASPDLVGQAASEEKLLWDNYDLSDLLFLFAAAFRMNLRFYKKTFEKSDNNELQ